MAHAMLFPNAPSAKERRAQKGKSSPNDLRSFSGEFLRQARAVLEHAPP